MNSRKLSHEARELALAALPKPIQATLRGQLDGSNFCGVISAADAEEMCREAQMTMHELMVGLVPVASLYANTPISGYRVGAVSQGVTTGNLYYGANMEFAGQALSFCLHGEQAATQNAWVHGEEGLAALAISAAPCGYCRQFLYDLNDAAALTILLPDRAAVTLGDLLPDAFGPGDLGVNARLMKPAAHGLVLDAPSTDPLVLQALAMADMSYAPYTGNYSAAAVQTPSGLIYAGPYAENAAYNPSMSPMEAALTHLNICGQLIEISRAVLVEVPTKASQRAASAAVLAALSEDIVLEYYTATVD